MNKALHKKLKHCIKRGRSWANIFDLRQKRASLRRNKEKERFVRRLKINRINKLFKGLNDL